MYTADDWNLSVGDGKVLPADLENHSAGKENHISVQVENGGENSDQFSDFLRSTDDALSDCKKLDTSLYFLLP